MVSKKRNYTLEMIKLIAAYMVVFIHVPFAGNMGAAVSALARFAVPLFFAVSGFYSYNIAPDKILKRTKNIFLLFIVGMGCFTLPKMALFVLSRDIQGIPAYFAEYLNWEALQSLIFFNVPVHADYLWYLLATLYVYLLWYVAVKCKVKENVLFVCGGILLIVTLVLKEGSALIGQPIHYPLLRTFVGMGFPFFAMGQLLKKYESKLCSINDVVIALIIGLGVAETMASFFCIGVQEVYLGSVLIVFGLMVIAVKRANAVCVPLASRLSGCSTYIYFLHPILSGIMIRGYAMAHIDYAASAALQWVHPFLVCVVSTVLAYGMVKTVHKWVFGK